MSSGVDKDGGGAAAQVEEENVGAGASSSSLLPKEKGKSTFDDLLKGLISSNGGSGAALGSNPVLAQRRVNKTNRMAAAMESKARAEVLKSSRAEKRKFDDMKVVRPQDARGASSHARERALRKTATKGVVALFNAIQKHQKQSSVNAAKAKRHASGKKNAKDISKDSFLDILKGGGKSKSKAASSSSSNANAQEAARGSGWSALKPDLLMGATLKGYDDADAIDEDVA